MTRTFPLLAAFVLFSATGAGAQVVNPATQPVGATSAAAGTVYSSYARPAGPYYVSGYAPYGSYHAPAVGGYAATTNVATAAPLGSTPRPTVGAEYVPPYSYWVVNPGHPARSYQGYGNNDFPFHGRPYGRAYESWSYPTLSGGYYNALARYYAPPL